MADEGPSLPSNYVTILHLKERWLKQQQSSANPNPQKSDSNSTLEPKHDSASKIPNESVHPRTNRTRITNPLKPDVMPHDSASKTPNESDSNFTHKPKHDSASKPPNESVHPRTNRPRIINQHNHDVIPHDSPSKSPKESAHRRRNHHLGINQPKPEAPVHDSVSKTVVQVADNHQTEENQKHNTDQSKPKSSKTKRSSKKRNPRLVTDQIPTEGNTTLLEPEPEPEPVPEKKQHGQKGGHRNRNQKVREPKSETPPIAPKSDDSSRNDFGGDGVVEAVATAVKEINVTDVSQRTDRRWDSGGFHGGRRTGPAKPTFRVKEQTTTAIWVRKGESASN